MTREQLEEQAERSRADVADTLGELNKRLSPGQIVDEVMAYMQGGGNDFLSNLGKQVTSNPMPVTLIGAGLAWFLMGKDSASSGQMDMRRTRGNGSYYPSSTDSGVSGIANSVGNTVGDMASATGEAVNSAAKAVGDAASTAYHETADAFQTAKNSVMSAEEKTMAVARSTIAFCQDQPLVLAGVGLALGAAMGAALPSTKLEDELLGEASDELKNSAKDLAVDQLGKAKVVGEKLTDALQEDSEPGLKSQSNPQENRPNRWN